MPITRISSNDIRDTTIVNADIAADAAIADTKLATIATAAKVSNSATTGTSNPNPNTLVLRDGSGNTAFRTVQADTVSASVNVRGPAIEATSSIRLLGTLGETEMVAYRDAVTRGVRLEGLERIDVVGTIQTEALSALEVNSGSVTANDIVADGITANGIVAQHLYIEAGTCTAAPTIPVDIVNKGYVDGFGLGLGSSGRVVKTLTNGTPVDFANFNVWDGEPATGKLTFFPPSAFNDGQTIKIGDGTHARVQFELDKAGNGVASGNIAVDISTAATSADIAEAFYNALLTVDVADLDITASYTPGNNFVDLENNTIGIIGNDQITDTVTYPPFVPVGMSGGGYRNSMRSGVLEYTLKVGQDTAIQVLSGSARFSVTKEGAVLTANVNTTAETASQVLSARTGTLTGGVTISAVDNVATLTATFTSSLTPDLMEFTYSYTSPDAVLATIF